MTIPGAEGCYWTSGSPVDTTAYPNSGDLRDGGRVALMLLQVTIVLLDRVIDTDYGQFDITWDDDGGFDGNFDPFFDGQVNGLVGAARPDGVYFVLARRSGGSTVRIELCESAPHDPGAEYQDVVEVSLTIPDDADVLWLSWAGESSGDLAVPPGSYRLRASARDRDAGRDGEFADRPVDANLMQFWESPPEPDAIVRVGSEDARYWHQEIGSRR